MNETTTDTKAGWINRHEFEEAEDRPHLSETILENLPFMVVAVCTVVLLAKGII